MPTRTQLLQTEHEIRDALELAGVRRLRAIPSALAGLSLPAPVIDRMRRA